MFDPEDMNLNDKNKEETTNEKEDIMQVTEDTSEVFEDTVIGEAAFTEEEPKEEATEVEEFFCAKNEQTEEKIEGPCLREYRYEEQVKKTPKRKRGWGKFIAACLIASVAGGASMGAGYGAAKYYFAGEPVVTNTPVVAQKVSSITGMSAVDIIKSVKPSVVSISTKVTGTSEYFGSFSVPYESNGVGSGVIFYSDDEKVAIATNNHVVDGASSIFVTFDGDVNVPAKVVGTKSESDLAVLTVSWSDLRGAGIKEVSVASFGDSDSLQVGDSVIAIGNAMGMGLSATDGMVSMTEQNINVEGNQLTVLQTSAAINGGNSGGPLVNSAGEVVGINTAKYNSSMAEGMGYAIPSNVISPIVDDLLENGTKPKPYIGIKGTSITSENADLYKLPVGALIMEVAEGGPAEQAGIKVGDIITSFNGNTVMDMDSLVQVVGETKVGATVDVHVVRDGKTGHDLKLTITDKNS